ncbi:MAG: response regulator [Candidatus Binatia bacterium]
MKTILLADDDATLRELARLTMNDPEYCIIEANDGREALELARTNLPDLLILDWMMPGLSGIEVAHALRQDPHTAQIPVIMLTAKGQEKDKDQGRAVGVQGYLVKPFSPLDLRTKIQNLWKQQKVSISDSECTDTEIALTKPKKFQQPPPSDNSQLLLYARDLARVIEAERKKTQALERVNVVLQTEIEERKRVEDALRRAHTELEHRVQERTAELSAMNAKLTTEIAAREKAEEALHTLSRQVLEAQENERRRLARELHDEIGQALTALKFNLHAAQRQPTTLGPRVEDSLGIVNRTLQQVRNLSLDLRPSLLDDLGLVAALNWYMERQAERIGFISHVTTDPMPQDLSPTIAITCFRVVQEAVTNAARHAHARDVWIDLRKRNLQLALSIKDNGSGFDVPAAQERASLGMSMGLTGMHERVRLVGGQLTIHSRVGKGTEIRVILPLKMKGEL